MTEHASTSAFYGVANKFADNGTDRTDPKTIFIIQNPQKPGSPISQFVDVSWISPYSSEREVIMNNITGFALICPRQFLVNDCKHKELVCRHSLDTCFKK